MSAPPRDVFAFVLVFEASYNVALEAKYFLGLCVPSILKRIVDVRGTSILVKTAVVTYGTSDSVPTPLLFRRSFADWSELSNKIQHGAWSYFHLGTVNAPGPSGMSALEGLVAAVELLQDYDSSLRNANVSKYIIHIASSDPDAFVNPMWNNLPELDDVTWDSLPDQLKERNINYNLMTTGNKPETFARLYAKTSEGKATPPWFTLLQNNSISLAGIPAAPVPAPVATPTPAPQTVAKPTPKRPNDASPDQPRHEPKRPRISDSPIQAAAKPTPAATKNATPQIAPAPMSPPSPSMPTPTQMPASLPAPPAAPAASAPPLPTNLGPLPRTLEEVRMVGAQVQTRFHQARKIMQEAILRGDKALQEKVAKELPVLKAALEALQLRFRTMQAEPLKQQGPQSQGPSSQQATAPQHNHGMAGQLSTGGFQPNTPENHPTGPQFGSPSMPPAANITMSQASTSMNPMAAAQNRAHAHQVQVAQARAQHAQGAPAQGGAGPRIGMPSSQSQPPATSADMERQYQEVLDWERKINQKGDANNRPIQPPAAPALPPFPLDQDLDNAIHTATEPRAVHPMEGVQKFHEMRNGLQPQNYQINFAVGLTKLRSEVMNEIMSKSVRERPNFPNFVDSQRPGGVHCVWKGTLKWPAYFFGTGASAAKEASMPVHVLHHDPPNCFAATWSPSLLLQLSPSPAVVSGQISAWLNKHQPVVCIIDIPSDIPEPQQSEYKKLYMQLQLALARPEGSYAWARWTSPSGSGQTTNAVFFNIGPKLVGAFYPLGGFPDLPHDIPLTLPMLLEFVKHHWPTVMVMAKSYIEKLKPQLRPLAGETLIKRIRERIQMLQKEQLATNMHVLTNGGTANREASGSFVMQPLNLPTTQQAEVLHRVTTVQRQRAAEIHRQNQLQQQQQQQALVAAMMNNGSTGGMMGVGNVVGMNMNNMGNMAGMNMGAGMPNMNNMGNMIAGMPNMGNMGNFGGSNMAMGGMQMGMPNMGNMAGMNMGNMGGHGGQQQ